MLSGVIFFMEEKHMFGKSKKITRRIKLPFESTDGKPYIFASYGHDDKEKVFPALKELYESGFNVWYDEGITIGERYDEIIENHILGCSAFVLFASKLSLSRPYILDVELEIARRLSPDIPVIAYIIERDVQIPERTQEIINKKLVYSVNELTGMLEIKNSGNRKAIPVEREVPQYWFDSYDRDPAGENEGGVVWSAEEPYACLAFHPNDLSACNPYVKELFFAGYNVRSCEYLGETERKKCLTGKGCRAYVPFITKNYVESGLLKSDFLAAKKAGKPLVALYVRKTGNDGNEEKFTLPEDIAEEFSLLQGLDLGELTDNDFLSKLESELERRKCFAMSENGKVVRRSFEIKDFLYDFTDGGKRLVLTKYRGGKSVSSLDVKRAYYGFPVSDIGENAFRYCGDLLHIRLGEGIEGIGNGAFYSCGSLEDIAVPGSVTSLGEYAFSKCSSLKSLRLPDGLKNIPHGAFEDCDSLTAFTIPDGVTDIEKSAFSQCCGLLSVSIPDTVRSVGDFAFFDCDSLKTLELPDSVQSLGDGVFIGCQSLEYVRLPEGMVSTGSENFRECGSLRKIVIPEGLTVIDDYAFYGCDGLEEINIPESVESIGEHAFADCDNLKRITIPAGVTEIGDYAFENCLELECVTILSDDAEIGEGALDYCDLVRCSEGGQVWEYCEENAVDCEPL